MESPIQVLQLTIGGTDFTGICSFMYTYYKVINHNNVIYDFVFCRENSMKLVMNDPVFNDSCFFELNAINRRNEINYWKFAKKMNTLLKKKNYDVLHINTHKSGITLVALLIAKKNRIKTIISHSHNDNMIIKKRRLVKDILKKLFSAIIRHESSYLFACSKEAGKALFAEKGIKQNNFYVVKNAINSKQFIFDEEIRKKIRSMQNIEDDCYIVGQVGRLSYQKNQIFTLNVFKEILIHHPNTILWLIGTGEDMEKLKKVICQLEIQDKVQFLGARQDIASLMQAMDALIFPSEYEGLGIVAVEAQAAGLKTYASTAVPIETKITDLISYIPLSASPKKWASIMLHDLNNYQRRNRKQEIIESGYDIEEAAKWLENFYVHCRFGGTYERK